MRCGFERRNWDGANTHPSSNTISSIEDNGDNEQSQPQNITQPQSSQPIRAAVPTPPSSTSSPFSYPKFCRYCGASLDPEGEERAKFCSNCGRPITRGPSGSQTAVVTQSPVLRASPDPPSLRKELQTEPAPIVFESTTRMKTANVVIGSVLTILGVIFIVFALIISSGTCSTTNAASALFSLPTCGQLVIVFLSLFIVGISFAVVGIIILFKGRQKVTIGSYQHQFSGQRN